MKDERGALQEEQGDNLIITTAAMRAVMNEATGQITFYDLKDNVLLNGPSIRCHERTWY